MSEEKEIEYLKKLKAKFEAVSEFKIFLENNDVLKIYSENLTKEIDKSIQEIEDKYLLKIYVISRLLSNRGSNFLKNRKQILNSDGINNSNANNSIYISASSQTRIQNPKLKEHIIAHIKNNLSKYQALIGRNAALKAAFKSNFNYNLEQKLKDQFKELHSRWNEKFNESISSLKVHSLSCLHIAKEIYSLGKSLNLASSPDNRSAEEFKFEKIKSKTFVLLIDLSGSIKKEKLDKMKEELTKSLEKLKKDEPNAKVALITFDSGGYYYGDGKQKNKTIKIDDFLNNKRAELNQIRADAQKLESIQDSCPNLIKKIGELFVGGGSCISSPLAHSIVLASAFENSEVIILTDGVVDSQKDNCINSIDTYFKEFGVAKIKTNSNYNLDFLKKLCKDKFKEISDFNDLFKNLHEEEKTSEQNGQNAQRSIINDESDVGLKEIFKDLDVDVDFAKKFDKDLEDLFSLKALCSPEQPDYSRNKISLCSYIMILRSIDIFERAVQLSKMFKLLLKGVNQNDPSQGTIQEPNLNESLEKSIINVYEHLKQREQIKINLNGMFESIADEMNKFALSYEDDYIEEKLFECVQSEMFQKSLELSENLDKY